uniref:Extracellular calcium-sensing receptor-like n=1 Tax=Xiphophorus maculatus TaxID=8083 RepID=A0A3B5QDW1_XIPMA
MLLFRLLLISVLAKTGRTGCRLLGGTQQPELAQDGDLIIGGIFSFHFKLCCMFHSFNFREFKFAQTMIFAINEINRNPEMLSGVRLGYKIYGNCGTMDILRAALALVSGLQEDVADVGCPDTEAVRAILGHSGSTPTIAFSQIVGRFQIPVISHFATCACLSNRKEHPTFFRTIPSDYYQSRALAKLVRHFGWTWVGAIAVDNEYGLDGIAAFIQAAEEYGICVEYSEAFSSSDPPHVVQRITETIKQSTSKVIMAFMSHREIKILASELHKQNITGPQWIGSDAWITDSSLADGEGHTVLLGSFGFTVPKAKIPGLEDQFVKDFWEEVFDCSLNDTVNSQRRPCSGTESLQTVESPFTDVSELRFTNNVYKSVFAVAHALDLIIKCGGNKILQSLHRVNFTTVNGQRVYFDRNGDSPARYELVNLQITKRGIMEGETVGIYDATFPDDQQFIMNNISVVWANGLLEAPVSECSKKCLPGTYKVLQKGKPICCHDCIPCPAGEITNLTESLQCFKCPPEHWSNNQRDSCIPKPVEFLSYNEILGMVLAMCSLLGILLTTIAALIFFTHKETPIVRANNSELSFLLLASLTLCFLCSLTFIGRPTEWSCMLRHTAFGMTFVLCISCVLGKTMVVLIAFRATRPGSNVMKWFGPAQQRLSVLAFTLVQVLICLLWLSISPPFPFMNFVLFEERIVLQCDLGSAIGFYAVLGYIGFLSVLCFVLAFLARKLPDNFNEAKFITFSMLIFTSVWITFIPAYVSSPGKLSDAVEIFAILASAYGVLFCIFLPKCWIILFRPEQNTKKHIMGKTVKTDIQY